MPAAHVHSRGYSHLEQRKQTPMKPTWLLVAGLAAAPLGLQPAGAGTSADRFVTAVYQQLKGGG